MLSNQTCYWGVPTPLHEKHRDRESGGGMVPPVGADCYHDTVMLDGVAHSMQADITSPLLILSMDTFTMKKRKMWVFSVCVCVCLFCPHQRAASNQLGYCDTSQDKTQLLHHI